MLDCILTSLFRDGEVRYRGETTMRAMVGMSTRYDTKSRQAINVW